MKILKFIITAAVLICVIQAQASKNISNRALINQINAQFQAKKSRLTNTKLLKFMISPTTPKVTEEVSSFIQPLTGFTDSEILLQIYLDGQLVTNAEQPAAELWVADFGAFSESKSYTVSAKVFLRDKNAAKLITDAILVLDGEIAELNSQIENELDPEVIADLTAQRDDKLAQRNELIATLAGLEVQIAEESHEFFVQEDLVAPGYPRIASIEPNVVKSNTVRSITINGENFDNLTAVKVDGFNVTVSYFQSNLINVLLPGLAPGAHQVEVQTISSGVVRNTIQKNAIFAAANDLGNINVPPVAVAQVAVSPIALGAQASISAASSFDPNNFPITYQWSYFSGPPGSNLPTEPVVSAAQTHTFTPSVPGLYIVRLNVIHAQSPNLQSAPVYAIIEVLAPANRAPALSAAPISVLVNQSASTTVYGSDADFWQENRMAISRQSSLGSASLVNGELSFTAGSQTGTDSITVVRFDNGSPPLATSVNIPVTVASSNQAPVINSLTATVVSQNLPAFVRLTADVSDPNGASDLATMTVDTGDGIIEHIPTFGPVLGLVNHNYHAYGAYTATLTVTDKFGAVTSQQFTLNINQTDLPKARFLLSTYSCAVPCTIAPDASTSSDQQGITSYIWNWGDGSPDENGGVSPSHTYTVAGSYFIRLQARDSDGAEGEAWAQVYIGVQAPANGPSSYGVITASPNREVLVNAPVNFDGTLSFDPITGGDVSSYAWRRNGGCSASGPNCVATGPTASFFFPTSGTFFPRIITTNSLGRSTTHANTEIISVLAGHAPKALYTINGVVRPQAVSGTAPYLVTANSSLSYDYDGTIVSRFWDFGDSTTASDIEVTKVYQTPGVYFIFLSVTDNDGNQPSRSQMIVVNPPGKSNSKSNKPKSASESEHEQFLVEACGRDDGEACYTLANIYLNQGNTFVYEKLMERACMLSYQPACSKRKGI